MKLKQILACTFSLILCYQTMNFIEYNDIFNNSLCVYAYSNGIYKVNTSSGIKVRAEATTNSTYLGASSNGTEFEVTEINGNWGYTPSIYCTNGYQSGWVYLSYCEQISTTTNKQYVTGDWHVDTPSGVAVKSGPGSDYERVDGGSGCGSPNGTSFTVVEVNGNWGRTESIYSVGPYGYVAGWVSLQYCTLDNAYDPNPVVDPTYSKISINKNVYSVGEAINFTFESDGIGKYTLGIDDEINSIRYDTISNLDSTYAYANLPPGQYSAYVTAAGNTTYKDSDRVYFTIEDTINLGEKFDALIILKNPWGIITSSSVDLLSSVVMHTEDGSTKELWRFERLSDGSYSIKNFATGGYLDAYGSGINNGTDVITAINSEITSNQRWFISKTTDGNGYALRPAYSSSLMLDVDDGSNAKNKSANVQLYNRIWNGINQTFSIYNEGNTSWGKPHVPKINISDITTSSVKISWGKTTYCDKYIIQRSTDNETWITIDETENLYYTDKNLSDNTTYYYRVCGANRFYNDDNTYSDSISLKTDALPKYTITFDANGGSCAIKSKTVKKGLSYGNDDTDKLPVPTWENYEFLGWYTDALKGDKITNSTICNLNENQTLYAHWKDPNTQEPPKIIKDNTLIFGKDTWSFTNSSNNFHKKYNIGNEELYNWLKQNSNNINWTNIKGAMDYDWEGSCYGMSVVEVLAKLGYISADDITKGVINISNLNVPIKEVSVESIINYFHVTQYVTHWLNAKGEYSHLKNAERIDKLIDSVSKIKDGEAPSVVCFGYTKSPSSQHSCDGGHAVVAYGIEYGSWDCAPGYNCRILTSDPAFTDLNEEACIYINTDTHSWTIPYYDNRYYCCHNDNTDDRINTKAKIEFVVNSLSLLDMYNLTNNISSPINVAKTSSTIDITKETKDVHVNYYSDTPGFQSTECDLDFFSDFNSTLDENIINSNINVKAFLPEADVPYEYFEKTIQDYSTSICYSNSNLSIELTDGISTIFKPDKSIEFKGKNSDYTMSMVLNDGYYPTDWYSISTYGINSNESSLSVTNEGYILDSDSLVSGVSIIVENRDGTANKYFSIDADSVLIYEIDSKTIGLKIDSNNDGIYDKDITNDITPNFDISGDSKINNMDLLLLKKHILNISNLSKRSVVIADINGDNKVDILDFMQLKSFVIKNK